MAEEIFERLEQVSHVTIHCAACVNLGKRTPAFTVIKNFAVCRKHVPLVSRPDFTAESLRSKRGDPT